MVVIKLIVKIMLIPILLILAVIKWIGVFLTAMSSLIFYLIAGVFFLTGVLSYVFNLETGVECLHILAGGFIVFMIPVTATMVVDGIAFIQIILLDFIWS